MTMLDVTLFEAVLDNAPEGIYILDNDGNYIYANAHYINMTQMSKSELLSYNVRTFFNTGQIDICISDIVYREKRRICMFQDVFYEEDKKDKWRHRQLIVSTPVFDDNGEVCNIVAFVRPLDSIDDVYYEANAIEAVSRATIPVPTMSTTLSVVGESPAMKSLLVMARAMADVDSSVLITGESGVGKEVIAQWIHKVGKRSGRDMVVINCASLPPSLLEAELFGYEKGAFTGAATTGKAGLFEEADGSTLMLDEVNSLPLELQGKLLRAIETKKIQRIGSTRQHDVDFRLIAASNEDLSAMVEERRFRADLFYRLNVIPLHIPPLRERREDILPLAFHFLRDYCEKYNKTKVFAQQTLNLIEQYDWPGNVRELKNFVERAVVMSVGVLIDVPVVKGVGKANVSSVIPQEPRGQTSENFENMVRSGITLNEHLDACEAAYLQYVIDGYKSSYLAANVLGISQASVIRKKHKHGIK